MLFLRVLVVALLSAPALLASAEPEACQPQDGDDVCRKRCEAGSQPSCAVLGIMYMRGDLGRKPDYAKAEPLLEAACTAKVALGCGGLGTLHMVRKDEKKGMPLLDKGCTMGDALACESLGGIHSGAGGSKPPADLKAGIKKASVYYRRACDLGSGAGCGFVASFIHDRAIPGTAKEALDLYVKACSRSIDVACRLGADFMTDKMFTSSAFAATVDVPRLTADLLARGCKLGDAKACARTKQP